MTTFEAMHRGTRSTAATLCLLILPMLLAGCADKPETLLASAREYIARNDHPAAVIQLKNVLQKNPDLAEARLLLGRSLLESGDAGAAEVELRKAQALGHPVEQVAPSLARSLLMQGQYRKVTDEFAGTEIASADPRADLRTTVGNAYLLQGNAEAASAAFAAALVALNDYGPAMVGQARIMAGNRDLAGALATLDAALERTPALHEAWHLKGDILYVQGDLKGSVDAYRRTLEIRPGHLPALSSLVSRLIESDDLDAAARQLATMKTLAPKHARISYLQAQLSYRQKNYREARESIQKYLTGAPDDALGLQLAGAIEYELQSYAMAERHLLKALPNSPETGLARRLLIAGYLRSGQPAKALSMLQPVLGRIDNDSNMQALAGEVFLQNGDAEKAGVHFAKASALDPGSTGKRTSLALAQLAMGDTDKAYRELEQIAAVDTGTHADLALISSRLAARQFDEALTAIGGLERKLPDNPMVPNLYGTALLGKGDTAAARRRFEQAVAMNPAYFPAAANLANLDLADRKPEAAKKRFETVIAADPKSLQGLLALAALRGRTGGRSEEVVEPINQAIAANPAESAPRVALIAHYLGSKETKGALTAAQEALVAFPERPEILDMAGRAQQAGGELNQALVSYGKLAALMPDSPQPYLRMSEIQVQMKDRDGAMQSLRKALAIKTDSLAAQRGTMMLDFDAGRTGEALATARQIQRQRPQEAVGYVLEGDVHALRKAWPEAVAAYRSGMKKSRDTELAVRLHAALIAGGSAGEGERFAETWLKTHPKDMSFRLYLAEVAGARKDFATASRHYKVMLDADPDNPALLNNVAWAMSMNHDPKGLEYAEKAYRLAPDQPEVIDTLGVLLMEKGEAIRGLPMLQKAVSLDPQNASYRLNLAKAWVKTGNKEAAKKELEALIALGDRFAGQPEAVRLLQNL